MSSIFNLNKENAPFTHSLREALPFQGFFFKYDIQNKGEGTSTAVHLVRSAITLAAFAGFIVAGLVEKAVRFIFDMIKKGIDKVLTKDQQDNIKNKAEKVGDQAKEAGKGFYQKHFAPLFNAA